MMEKLTDLYSDAYFRFKKAIFLFVGAIVLSFFVYSRLVKWATKKFDLEEKMDPLFSSRRNRSRDRMD